MIDLTEIMTKVATVEDTYSLRGKVNYFDRIDINAKELKYTGALRYALKYALFSLKIGGKLHIQDEPFQSFGYSRRRIDFWQVKYQAFLLLSDDCEEELVDDSNGKLVFKRTKDRHHNDGVSFGVIFSGSDKELPFLIKTLYSCAAQTQSMNTEIILCGPNDWSIDILPVCLRRRVRYLPFIFSRSSSRFLIQEKKRFLYQNAVHNIVAICHARVVWPADFVEKIMSRPIEFMTPRQVAEQNGREFTYLAFTFIGDYNVTKPDIRSGFGGELVDDDFLYYMRHRVPYISGGILVLNRNIVSDECFNPNIAWGEAEDIDLSMRVSANGHLIDYWPEIKCKSLSAKYTFDFSIKKRILRYFARIALRRGYV